jgi:hypothetical protein
MRFVVSRSNQIPYYNLPSSIAAHIFRLLLTPHILREVLPDVFTNNRIGALLDSGKGSVELGAVESAEKKKHEGTGRARFQGACKIQVCLFLLLTPVKITVHDFFTLQPILDASIFLLPVVLHD